MEWQLDAYLYVLPYGGITLGSRKTMLFRWGLQRALPHNLCCKRITFGDFIWAKHFKTSWKSGRSFYPCQTVWRSETVKSVLSFEKSQQSSRCRAAVGAGWGWSIKPLWRLVHSRLRASFCACALQSVQQPAADTALSFDAVAPSASGSCWFQTGSL